MLELQAHGDPTRATADVPHHVLTGTMRRDGDAYRFNLQLIRATDALLVWGQQIDVNERSLFTIEDQVTLEVVAALQLEISTTERARLTRSSTQNLWPTTSTFRSAHSSPTTAPRIFVRR
jgi:hypothetical protein